MEDVSLQLEIITKGAGRIWSILDHGRLEESLCRIETAEQWLAGDPTGSSRLRNMRLCDLRRLEASQGLRDSLAALRARIGQAYEKQFCDILIKDLQGHVASVVPTQIIERWEALSAIGKQTYTGASLQTPSY